MFRKPKKLKNPEDLEHGYNYALFLLGLRSRTEGELRSKMTERGYVGAVINQTIAKLYENRFINDQDYLQSFFDQQKQFGSHGYFWLKQKLMLRKLSSEVIEAALSEQFPEDDELSILERALLKELKQKQLADLSYPEKQKLAAKFARRGFRQNLVRSLIFE